MTVIISEQHWIKVFESLVSGPFNYFIKLGEVREFAVCHCPWPHYVCSCQDLHDRAKKSLNKHDFIVVVSTCRVIRHLKMLLPQYEKLLKSFPNRCYSRLPELISMFEKLVSFTYCFVRSCVNMCVFQTLKGLMELLNFIKVN